MVSPKTYLCSFIDAPLKLTGKLDDPAWEQAEWTDDFIDIQGGAMPKPRYRTRVKMLWDLEYFYVGAELEEPHVWGTLTEHDSVIFQDNDFEVFIDPDGDHHEYYEFEINALGTYWDLLLTKPYRDNGTAVNAWEIPELIAKVHVNGTLNDSSDVDRGWTVEMAFPWSVLKECSRMSTPPKSGDCWRVNFSRVQWEHQIVDGRYEKVKGKPEDNWVWSPQHFIDMHRPEYWGFVQFCKGGVAHQFEDQKQVWAVQELMIRCYRGLKAYRTDHGSYPDDLRMIKDREVFQISEFDHLRYEKTTRMFEISCEVHTSTGMRRCVIDHESRFRVLEI